MSHLLSDKTITDELRNQCKLNGEEINPQESAILLHKLGLVYKEKSPDKISLIQSVALMTSAIIREPDNVEEIKKDLTDLCLHILTLANASKLDTSLVDEAVAEAKQAIKVFRETTKQKLESLKPISDDLQGDELDQQRNQRVECIRGLQDYVTKQYTEVMQLIARHTTTIMGEPPCKFALVGMGSLARKEITPYSDFENIIVLEEGIQLNKDHENTLEYFRWFASVFQMILVRLGETILKFLSIPCLNDPFNKENNWFYDKYTPCGICPDGFAPQASKNPLGRQTKTKKKPWITELIKPVSEMVKYLDTEEDLKEGYHLADMLTQTCFVCGANELYNEFKGRVEEAFEKRDALNVENKKQIKDNLESFQVLETLPWRTDFIDTKRFLYRSSSLFIQALGRLHGTLFSNSFDIVNDLLSRDIINSATHEEYQFSLAIACEMRLRTYSNASAQDDFRYSSRLDGTPSSTGDLAKLIGNRAIVDCLSYAGKLQHTISSLYQIEIPLGSFTYNIYETPVVVAFYLGLNEFAVQLVKETIRKPFFEKNEKKLTLMPHLATALRLCGRYKSCIRTVKDWLPFAKKGFFIHETCQLLSNVAQSYFALVKYKQALKFYRKINSYANSYPTHDIMKMYISKEFALCFLKLGRFKRALKYFRRVDMKLADSKQENNLLQALPEFSLGYCKCLSELNQFAESERVAKNILIERLKLHSTEESDPFAVATFTLLGDNFYKQSRYIEALYCIDKTLQNHRLYDFDGSWTAFHRKIQCLIHLDRVLEASQWTNDNFTLTGFANLSVLDFQEPLIALSDLIDVLRERNETTRACRHLEQAKQLLPLAERCFHKSIADGTRHNVKQSYYAATVSDQVYLYSRFGDFLRDQKQPEEALKFFKKGFHIVFYVNWFPCKILKAAATFNLVKTLSECHRYRECLDAGKHAIKIYQSEYDNCCTDSHFCQIVEMCKSAECNLGITPSFPHDCTPSVFFYE